MSCVIALAPPPSSHYLCPTSPRSLNREALEEVLQQESAARPVCGSRSEAKPSSPPSHPSLFDILPIFFNPTKVHNKLSNAVQSFQPSCTVVTCDDHCDKKVLFYCGTEDYLHATAVVTGDDPTMTHHAVLRILYFPTFPGFPRLPRLPGVYL